MKGLLSALRQIATGFGIALLVVVVVAAVLYFFGGSMPPSADARDAYDSLVAQGVEEPVESHFVVPIPGCTCHSDDPAAIVPHAEYRMRDCGACH
ncbi:MAG: hypothetical protein JXR33_02725 [Coriobacteriia bacterium]|nr:hypothetical protein [Coriobacteriia bacterium]